MLHVLYGVLSEEIKNDSIDESEELMTINTNFEIQTADGSLIVPVIAKNDVARTLMCNYKKGDFVHLICEPVSADMHLGFEIKKIDDRGLVALATNRLIRQCL